jgi:RNA polymerase sigma factor (sigma-70 family)
LTVIHSKYYSRIKRYITSHIGNTPDVEDLAQDVFATLCTGKGRYDGHADVNSYLIGIAKNIIHRYHRRISKIKSSETVFIRSVSAKSSDDEIYQQLYKIFEDVETLLPPKERQAFRLRFVKGFSPKEAAKKTGCSIRTFYKRLERAERALREDLKNKKD